MLRQAKNRKNSIIGCGENDRQNRHWSFRAGNFGSKMISADFDNHFLRNQWSNFYDFWLDGASHQGESKYKKNFFCTYLGYRIISQLEIGSWSARNWLMRSPTRILIIALFKNLWSCDDHHTIGIMWFSRFFLIFFEAFIKTYLCLRFLTIP